jgi:predicted DNA-binding transcriptional regulator AlpA
VSTPQCQPLPTPAWSRLDTHGEVAGVKTELMAIREIANFLGVSRQRAHELVNRKGFPDPADSLAVGRIWFGAEVRAWAREWERRLAEGDK